jgi:magnesium-transporting ATPase (P-type)
MPTQAPPHVLPPGDVYAAFDSSPDGLTDAEARRRLTQHGPNTLRTLPGPPLWRRLLANLTHLMALLLWAGGALAFVGGMPQLGWAIWTVVVVNAAFSFWQEYKAGKATEALRRLLPVSARLVRGGRELKVPAAELVPGDLLLLAEGDSISADARLVEEHELRVNLSTLTGESAPARRSAEASHRPGLAPRSDRTSSSPARPSARGRAGRSSSPPGWARNSARSRA